MPTPGASDAAIVMFGDGRDWHGRSLTRAFKRRGIAPLLAPLNSCGFSTATKTGLDIPGLGDRLPEGAFVRFVPGGSFEEVTLYLGVLHALRELGVTVWNDARAIERCVDKSTTTFFIQRAGIPTPRTFARVGRADAEAITAAIKAACNIARFTFCTLCAGPECIPGKIAGCPATGWRNGRHEFLRSQN